MDTPALPAVIIGMGYIMSANHDNPSELLRRIAAGDDGAAAELFAAYRDRRSSSPATAAPNSRR